MLARKGINQNWSPSPVASSRAATIEVSEEPTELTWESQSLLQSREPGIGPKVIQFRFHLHEHQPVRAICKGLVEPVHCLFVFAQTNVDDREVIRGDVLCLGVKRQYRQQFFRFSLVASLGIGVSKR